MHNYYDLRALQDAHAATAVARQVASGQADRGEFAQNFREKLGRGNEAVAAGVTRDQIAQDALSDGLGNDAGERNGVWADGLCARHRERLAKAAANPAPQKGRDGRIHPMAVFEALQ